MDRIRVAGIVEESIVDGPGIRYVVFTQGCIHNCKGCHNQDSHSFNGGYNMKIEDILREMDKNPLLDGLTLSGGDPLAQPKPSAVLCREAKKKNLSTIVYTGYLYEDILSESVINPDYEKLLSYTDILIDGPFVEEEKDLMLKFRGSRNQRIIDVRKSLDYGRIVEIDL